MSRILVVEDDLALSAGLCFELDSGGYPTDERSYLWPGRNPAGHHHTDTAYHVGQFRSGCLCHR